MCKLDKQELVSINDIKIGDTVLHDGKQMTVGKENIKHSAFMGRTLFGDSYHLGYKPVVKLV
jgi:hypothetical protein